MEQFTQPSSAPIASAGRRPHNSNSAVLLAFAIGGAFLMLCLCGLVVLGLFLLENEVCAALCENPSIQAHLGPVEECELDMLASMADSRQDDFHYPLKSSSLSAVAIVRTEAEGIDGEEKIVGGRLVLAGGEEVEIIP